MKYDGYKLVRDKIPEIMRKAGSDRVCERVLDKPSYKELLLKKLYEEVAELDEALGTGNQDSIEGELADVHEVLVALSEEYRCRDVTDLASEKAACRGGLYQGYILKVDKENQRLYTVSINLLMETAMIRKSKEKLFEATFVVKEDMYLGNRFFRENDRFWYVAHLYNTTVEEDCKGDFPRENSVGIVIVDKEGTEINTSAKEVTDALINLTLDLEFQEKQ